MTTAMFNYVGDSGGTLSVIVINSEGVEAVIENRGHGNWRSVIVMKGGDTYRVVEEPNHAHRMLWPEEGVTAAPYPVCKEDLHLLVETASMAIRCGRKLGLDVDDMVESLQEVCIRMELPMDDVSGGEVPEEKTG